MRTTLLQAGLCQFLRSTDTYLPELTRNDLSQPYVLHQPLAVHPSASLHQRYRREHNFADGGSQAEIQPAHGRPRPQLEQSRPPCAAPHCCSMDSQSTALLMASTNLLLFLSLCSRAVTSVYKSPVMGRLV
ncbi:uncharacterized protein [Triticum aestivum]|uniref:uncharacterized protein n=1 Tax=Triticum aestivum TaxID=4565 RepID=UPI001D0236D2|nr:uncharacterized protein LOC123134705 [Triticum aestivum]